MAASKALTKKKDMLSELAFSGRHAKLWVLLQKYNAVCKDLREQTKWVALFHGKDRYSFADVLDENDVVPRELHTSLQCKHAKLVLKTDQPTAYVVINTKNCSLSIVLTAADQKPQKSLKRSYYPPSYCLNVNVMMSNMTFLMIFAVFDPSPLTL